MQLHLLANALSPHLKPQVALQAPPHSLEFRACAGRVFKACQGARMQLGRGSSCCSRHFAGSTRLHGRCDEVGTSSVKCAFSCNARNANHRTNLFYKQWSVGEQVDLTGCNDSVAEGGGLQRVQSECWGVDPMTGAQARDMLLDCAQSMAMSLHRGARIHSSKLVHGNGAPSQPQVIHHRHALSTLSCSARAALLPEP